MKRIAALVAVLLVTLAGCTTATQPRPTITVIVTAPVYPIQL